jgi:hypothetical protein
MDGSNGGNSGISRGLPRCHVQSRWVGNHRPAPPRCRHQSAMPWSHVEEVRSTVCLFSLPCTSGVIQDHVRACCWFQYYKRRRRSNLWFCWLAFFPNNILYCLYSFLLVVMFLHERFNLFVDEARLLFCVATSARARPCGGARVAVSKIRFIIQTTTLNVPGLPAWFVDDDDGRPMFLLKCMHVAIDRPRPAPAAAGRWRHAWVPF